MIEARALTFSWGKHKIIENLSFRVNPGECLVIAGANGTGKTTLLSILAGVLKPEAGEVTTDGRIGYVPQGSALLEDATVRENLRFFSDLAHAPIPENLPFAVRENLSKKVKNLSGGMKKQVSIACAMAGEPEILLLDEPCASLDLPFREDMTAMVTDWKRSGKAVVYVGHDPAEFEAFCSSVLFLSDPPVLLRRGDMEDFAGVYHTNIMKTKEG